LFYWILLFNQKKEKKDLTKILVSILVLLDFALQQFKIKLGGKNGKEFQSLFYWILLFNLPFCFCVKFLNCEVSILVLLDFALQHLTNFLYCLLYEVSILVLLDFALQLDLMHRRQYNNIGFNPCFIGFCSSTIYNDSTDVLTIKFQSLFYWILLFNR